MSAAIAGAQTPPATTSTLEERMSQADFRASGLDHLTPEQLKYLNAWLQSHGAGNAQVVSPSGQPVFYPDSGARDTIESHIVGTFTGWRGKTVFKLDNGQEWKQAESGMTSSSARRREFGSDIREWFFFAGPCRSRG